MVDIIVILVVDDLEQSREAAVVVGRKVLLHDFLLFGKLELLVE